MNATANQAARTMTAKFAGRCADCGGSISAGASIVWTKATGAKHVSCGGGFRSPTPAPAKRAPTSYGRGSAAVAAHWRSFAPIGSHDDD